MFGRSYCNIEKGKLAEHYMFCLCVLWKKFSDLQATDIIYLANTFWHNPEAQYWIWRKEYLMKYFIYIISYKYQGKLLWKFRTDYLYVIGNLNEHPNCIYIFILLRNDVNVILHPQCVILTTFLNKYVVKVKLLCLLLHVIGNSNEHPNYIYIFIGWSKDHR